MKANKIPVKFVLQPMLFAMTIFYNIMSQNKRPQTCFHLQKSFQGLKELYLSKLYRNYYSI